MMFCLVQLIMGRIVAAFSIAALIYGLGILSGYFYFASRLKEANVNLMIAQIKPHFLWNTLASIQTMIRVSPDDAYELLYDLSRYMRSSIDAISSEALISFQEELKNIKAYLNIEIMRFGSILDIEYKIEADDFEVAPLSIQPIVENAVKHGITKEKKTLHIQISSYATEKEYYIIVEDDGKGFDRHCLNNKADSAGIANIRYRLEKQMNAHLILKSEIGMGTKVTVILLKK